MFESRFLLASLHIKAILRGTTIAGRKRALKSIKGGAGLGDAYGTTLERIGAQDAEKTKLAMATLTWVCHSERPLQVDELCHALAVEIGATDFDSENIPSIGTLLHCCQGLIMIDKEASIVRLIHHTVQEYLCSRPGLFGNPHSILAETCLTFLNSQKVKDLTPHSPSGHQSTPFLKYSSRYWGTHAKRELSDHGRTLALELLGQYRDHVAAVTLLKQVVYPSYAGDIGTSSFFSGGHGGVVKLLLGREDVDPNRPDHDGNAPLRCAAGNGHEGVVKLLLGRGDVDPNRPDKYDQTPLGCAASSGHEGIVKLLLVREDVDPSRPDGDDRTPLVCAAIHGYEGVVKLLLETEGDPNKPDKYGGTPLSYATMRGHEGVVKLLHPRMPVESVDAERPISYKRPRLG